MKKTILFFLATTSMLCAAPKAVVFGFDNVLLKKPNHEILFQFIGESVHLTPCDWKKILSERNAALEAGKTDADFWPEFFTNLKFILDKEWPDKFFEVLKDTFPINHEMYGLAYKLKSQHIPIALLSNTNEYLAIFFRHSDYFAPFDYCLFSYEIGLSKSDPKIYEYLQTKLAVPAQDILFVDDEMVNIEAAKKMGFDAILFTSAKQFSQELKKRNL